MSERNTVNVLEQQVCHEVGRGKALLAMIATKTFVEGDEEGFHTFNQSLIDLSEQLDVAPTVTYGDLLFEATGPDTLVMSSESEEVMQAEADFYDVHHNIEKKLYLAVDDLTGHESAEERGFEAIELFSDAMRIAGAMYRTMDLKLFNAFRPYFCGINGLPGPSGLYSETIPIIDLLVHGGRNISVGERSAITRNLEQKLYPARFGKDELLSGLLARPDPAVDLRPEIRNAFVGQLDGFRRLHLACVSKFVPQALESGAVGTGGVVDVASYLGSKVLKTRQGDGDD